jgi:hypothetical protein
VLQRRGNTCRGTTQADLLEFMLPPDDPDVPGMEMDVIEDPVWGTGGTPGPWLPGVDLDVRRNLLPACDVVNWSQARAIAVTLRARTESEDAGFFIPEYPLDTAARNFGMDLDGDHENGLAHVRVEQSVVLLRNMSLALSPAAGG